MCKADNAVQVTKALEDVTNQSISSQTVRCNLREFGLQPVVKRKCPLLKHAIGGRGCNGLRGAKSILRRTEKGFFGLMKPKSIVWGQMGGNGYGKRWESH
jgi:hypothetical protein